MTTGTSRSRCGFTIIELLVAIGIIGMLMAVLLPAVQTVRSAARRTECGNHLRQLGLALHNYESMFGHFPPSRIAPAEIQAACEPGELEVADNPGQCTEYVAWTVLCLPHLEQSSLHFQYDACQPWSSLTNRSVVSRALSVMTCPAAPGGDRRDRRHVRGAAPGDYAGVVVVESAMFTDVFGIPDPGPHARRGALSEHSANPLRDIRDGLSATALVAECAGRPAVFVKQQPMTASQYFSSSADDVVADGDGYSAASGSGWADPEANLEIAGFGDDGITAYGQRLINANNAGAIFSFHPGGAQMLYADGAVRFLSESTDAWLLVSLCTRAGGESVDGF
jgi:prepilin-type N-terminal cleavage/methylation domain-containing protein/prepilin-type processing-associated H-X9-DG protein